MLKIMFTRGWQEGEGSQFSASVGGAEEEWVLLCSPHVGELMWVINSQPRTKKPQKLKTDDDERYTIIT